MHDLYLTVESFLREVNVKTGIFKYQNKYFLVTWGIPPALFGKE